MVVSANRLASEIGTDILKRGGNAADAAVATGMALAVAYPRAGNLGGGGFAVVRLADGRATSIDFRETAPAAASRDMYLDEQGRVVPRPVDGGLQGRRCAGHGRGAGAAARQVWFRKTELVRAAGAGAPPGRTGLCGVHGAGARPARQQPAARTVSRVHACLPARRQLLRRGRHVPAAGPGEDPAAHAEGRRGGILQGRNRQIDRKGPGRARRHHRAGRSCRLQRRGA